MRVISKANTVEAIKIWNGVRQAASFAPKWAITDIRKQAVESAKRIITNETR